jgi:UDP-N-acetylmuramoyl-L-alanyl-D-glutamate--2,6-diaminopimelate ligase
MFFARPGTKSDGARYVLQAIERGASVVVVSQAIAGLSVPQIVVDDVSRVIGPIAQAFYGAPGQALDVMAVTGTNGKTTTAYLIRHVLTRLGIKCGLIGTVEIDDGRESRESDMTTPPPIELAKLMAEMRSNGCRAVAIEASSHALDQHRLAGVRIAAAGFTNLTGDHLDYHGTMEAYAAAKARLFAMLEPAGPAVVNADSPWAPRMIQETRGRVLRFHLDPALPDEVASSDDGPIWRLTDIHADASGTRAMLHTSGALMSESIPLKLALVGEHNLQNALVAIAMCTERYRLCVRDVVTVIADAIGAPGRLQPVQVSTAGAGSGSSSRSTKPKVSVLVDYAHTDDALANVLRAVRKLTRGRVRVVFGCGGDRDRTKRPRMARIAREMSDVVYVTSDNPRTENPQAIIDETVSGLRADERETVIVEPDRRQAIRRAIAEAEAEDVVLIAGKGHEKYQIIGQARLPFDDVAEAEAALGAAIDRSETSCQPQGGY